jgi:hypothetical protein
VYAVNGKVKRIIICLLLLVLFIINDAKCSPSLADLYQKCHAVIIGVNCYDKWSSLEILPRRPRSSDNKQLLLKTLPERNKVYISRR